MEWGSSVLRSAWLHMEGGRALPHSIVEGTVLDALLPTGRSTIWRCAVRCGTTSTITSTATVAWCRITTIIAIPTVHARTERSFDAAIGSVLTCKLSNHHSELFLQHLDAVVDDRIWRHTTNGLHVEEEALRDSIVIKRFIRIFRASIMRNAILVCGPMLISMVYRKYVVQVMF